jgi:ubiquinone/menaquinone biosynthesis C-methylase UbiE
MKINIGCGQNLLPGWNGIDVDLNTPAHIHQHVPPIPVGDGRADEIYAGHFLEHLDQVEGQEFMRECWRVLKPGGRLGIVVPDTDAVMRLWLRRSREIVEIPENVFRQANDLDDIGNVFLYGPVGGPYHKWSYCMPTLARLMADHGFRELHEIDRYNDPRLTCPSWFQCGIGAVKPL